MTKPKKRLLSKLSIVGIGLVVYLTKVKKTIEKAK